MSQRFSAAVQLEPAIAHCRTCAPWGHRLWALKMGREAHIAYILTRESAERMQTILDKACFVTPDLPCGICLRPAEAWETAKERSYILSLRFFEIDRAEIGEVLAPDVLDIMTQREMRAHGRLQIVDKSPARARLRIVGRSTRPMFP